MVTLYSQQARRIQHRAQQVDLPVNTLLFHAPNAAFLAGKRGVAGYRVSLFIVVLCATLAGFCMLLTGLAQLQS